MYRFLGLLMLSLFLSCTKTENDWFPNYPVYLELDLAYEDKDLKAPMAIRTLFMGKHRDYPLLSVQAWVA